MLDQMNLAELTSYDGVEAAVGGFLFHGAIEEFGGVPRPSPYDGCRWLAEAPTIAQTYTPASSGAMLLSVEALELERPVRPEFSGLPACPSGLYAFALQMGFPSASEISCDFLGLAQSFVSPSGYPRYAAIVEKLTAMGDPPDARGGFMAWVKCERGADGVQIVRPASYQREGRLFVVDCVAELRLADLADSARNRHDYLAGMFGRISARLDKLPIEKNSPRVSDLVREEPRIVTGANSRADHEKMPKWLCMGGAIA